ncbi:MAG TPA: GlsB/YeaQ/YmgE family stress response membrane protein [Ilumatobacteraceae bacterium]|nr:GlsB/YeaQ/YmgE family stress response membrane protein [Ilumatobacteraceae bacterium]
MLIFGLIGFGVLVGWLAQFILGRAAYTTDWGMALVAGLGGSFVGGLLASLLAGDGLAFKPSGVIGSIVGALIITAIWQWYANKKRSEVREADKKAARSGRHH